MKENIMSQPVKLVSLVVAILIVLSSLPTEFTIWGITTKPVDIISDIRPEQTEPISFNMENKTNTASFFLADLFSGKKAELVNSPMAVVVKDIPITGNIEQLKYFFEAAKNANSQQVRIAHYGDSAIEGDNISGDMRDKLQKKFGGYGLGFLSITAQDVRFRPSITHSFSETWDNASIFTINPKKLPVGINGEVFIPQGPSWVQYKTTSKYRRLKEFKTVKLFYTNAAKSTLNYTFDGNQKGSVQLEAGNEVNQVVIESKNKSGDIKIDFPQKGQGYFYGVSIENGNGIYVDNFPLRGNSGVNLNDIDQKVLDGFAKFLDYKLVILYFGLNIAGTETTDYSWYEREMIKVINKFKKSYPKCSFLIVSVSDKSVKKGSQFVTNPSIPKLVATQETIAKKTNVAFWNLFEAMGGNNSMSEWVNSAPPLASKDYTHFTSNGSQKVAEMLADAIVKAFDKNK